MSFDLHELGGSVFVSEAQETVINFCSLRDCFEIPQYRAGKALTVEETSEDAKMRTKVTLEAAKEHAKSFLARVYPRFEHREFRLTKEKLEVSGYTAFYRIQWREVLDEVAPRAFPNEIEVQVNPETGVITEYTAQNYSLPLGFRLALKEKEAARKAEDSIKDMFNNARLRLRRGPIVLMRYAAARDKHQKDRVFWVVLYSFEDLDTIDKEEGRFRRSSATRVYDAATGERVPEEE